MVTQDKTLYSGKDRAVSECENPLHSEGKADYNQGVNRKEENNIMAVQPVVNSPNLALVSKREERKCMDADTRADVLAWLLDIAREEPEFRAWLLAVVDEEMERRGIL